jgi:hypothetical protein
MDKQLTRAMHDPERQTLIEIMSGHGNSEDYRSWREFELGADGEKVCPAPTPGYLPCCWRAGEIMRERCGDLPESECEARAEKAKRLVMEANVTPHLVFPDTTGEDWLDCGQCRDCFKPPFGLRPRESVQYAMALSNLEEAGPDGEPLRFRYGFIASSDNHKARPGTGYKQYERRLMTEVTGVRSKFYAGIARLGGEADPREPQPVELKGGLMQRDTERVASFFYTGGLVAAHSEGRSREAIWDALARREVYGTSGPRRDQRAADPALVRPLECGRWCRSDGERAKLRRRPAIRGAGGRLPETATRVSRGERRCALTPATGTAVPG